MLIETTSPAVPASPAYGLYGECGPPDFLPIGVSIGAPQARPPQHESPRQKLWWAVIIDAFFVRDAAHQGNKGARPQYERDQTWIADESEGLLSFRWTCTQLGLDPQRVKQAYHNMPIKSWGKRKRRTRL